MLIFLKKKKIKRNGKKSRGELRLLKKTNVLSNLRKRRRKQKKRNNNSNNSSPHHCVLHLIFSLLKTSSKKKYLLRYSHLLKIFRK
jgi:predicted nucleic acid-binding protein